MKTLRLFLAVLLISLASAACAQTDAQNSFDKMKTLAGSWEGRITTTPPTPDVQGKTAKVSLRVTSTGHALMHEMRIDGREDDPITMFYVDDGRLMLTHYCDAGNRPRMTGKLSPDGKTVDFELLDISGEMKYHMHHSVFTVVDANHHTEDWTFMAGDKPVLAHFDLQRTK
jgi:hypothetical protein